MRRNKLLLERCTGDGRNRKHDGVIVTLKPDFAVVLGRFRNSLLEQRARLRRFVLDCCAAAPAK